MKFLALLRTQEAQHAWSMRWVIVSNFCIAGFMLETALKTKGFDAPPWVTWTFAGGVLWSILLATVAAALKPKDGLLKMPLGSVVVPKMPSMHPGSKPSDEPPA